MSDLHLHAPQYGYAGLYMDEELLEWLDNHTFPEESKYRNPEYYKKGYDIFTDDLVHSETTRACIFATIHKDATLYLMEKLEKAGMSAFVGKVNMDRNSPDILRETTEESYETTLEWLEESARFENVKPIITPRFIPSCSDELMEKLGALVKERNLPVQSHLDENLGEIEWVKELCPWADHYSGAYDHFHMMGETPTVMAHVVWPTEVEEPLLKRKNVFIAHSPSSNTNIASGIAPVKKYITEGFNVGLATDVAGGSNLHMFRMLTDMIQVSKLRWRLVSQDWKPLTFAEGFWVATRGGGSFFGKVGALEVGFDADILVIDTSCLRTPLIDELSPADRLEFYSYRHPGEFITEKYVMGRRLF